MSVKGIEAIRVVVVMLDRKATANDYAMVWNAAQGFVRGLCGIVHDHTEMIGPQATTTALMTVFARTLAQHTPEERRHMLTLIEKELAHFDADQPSPAEPPEDSLEAMESQAVDLSKITPQGNA
jgi:hypothetical protein